MPTAACRRTRSLRPSASDLAAREHLRLARLQDPPQRVLAGIDADLGRAREHSLGDEEPERVAGAEIHRAEPMRAPALAPEASARARAARRERAASCVPGRHPRPRGRAVAARRRRGGRRRADATSVIRTPISSPSTARSSASISAVNRGDAPSARPDADREQERRGERDDLGPPEHERGDEPEPRQRRVRAELRGRAPRHVRARSSATGVGTVARRSRTTSSAEIRCTHSSGRRVRRCASAGTAIDLTSSGVT